MRIRNLDGAVARESFWIVMNTLPILSCVALMCIGCSARDLRLIQAVFRHGDRAPDYAVRTLYPLDPYANETWYPNGWGALTERGKKRAYELGVFLRERYGEWLGDLHLEDNVVFRSSEINRTVMSTQLLAAGLFTPCKNQRKDSKLDSPPIPVIPDISQTKTLFLAKFFCPKFKAMRRELEETDEFLVNRASDLSEFFDFVSTNVGKKTGQAAARSIYNHLFAEMSENVILPEWTRGIFPEGKLEEVAAYDYVIQSYNKTMVQITGGLWIREWLKNIDSHLNGTQSREHKAFFYGGHESNIALILRALGVFKPHVPFYSSSIILELYDIENEFYVKVLHKNRDRLQELLIPNCESLDCPLDTFRELFADIIVFDKELSSCQ